MNKSKLNPIKDSLRELYLVGLEEQKESGTIVGKTMDDFNKEADKFADMVGDALIDEINNYIGTIQIIMNIPPSMISPIVPPIPGGPCSGMAKLDVK